MKLILVLFFLLFLSLSLCGQRDEIVSSQKGEVIIKTHDESKNLKQESNLKKGTKKEKDNGKIEVFSRNTKIGKIKIYIVSVFFFISLVYVVRSIKRRRLYK